MLQSSTMTTSKIFDKLWVLFCISFLWIRWIFLDIEKMREEIKAQLLANNEQMKDMDWDAKLEQVSFYLTIKRINTFFKYKSDKFLTNQLWQSRKEDDELKKISAPISNEPYFVNLNEDPMLSGVIKKAIKEGKEIVIGRKDADPKPDVILTGLRWKLTSQTYTFKYW